MDIRPVTLEGRVVRLEPMSIDHLDALCEVGLDERVWRWMRDLVTTRAAMRTFVEAALQTDRAGSTLTFVTVERSSGRAVGSSRFLNIDRLDRHLEIGFTWIAPPWQRTAVNSEQKLLMVGHAIERLGCHRVEFKTDSLNHPSRNALAGIGATEEGTFRRHMVVQQGRLRHSTYYSIVDTEWPAVKARLEDRLSRSGRAVS
ncbi:MAG: GNAT family N-acetyltransferase [Chloroflexi bacterium]|nr:GNAT family N-acetyltransferase [Chloroflexota bacterium]